MVPFRVSLRSTFYDDDVGFDFTVGSVGGLAVPPVIRTHTYIFVDRSSTVGHRPHPTVNQSRTRLTRRGTVGGLVSF